MDIVDIKIKKNTIYIMNSEDKVLDAELNNTTLLKVNKINFTTEYIKSNPKTILNFFRILIKNNDVHILKIKEFSLTPIILPIIKDIQEVDSLLINENITVNYEFYNLIKECDNIKNINVYNMPEYIFYTLSNTKHVVIRQDTLYKSKIMDCNNIHNISDIYYKKSIVVESDLVKSDLEELEIFLNINQKLKIVYIKHYLYLNLENIAYLLNKYNKKNVIINIYVNDNNNKIITKETKKINNVCFNNYLKIKYVYEKDYNKKHLFENINYQLLISIFICLLIILIMVILSF